MEKLLMITYASLYKGMLGIPEQFIMVLCLWDTQTQGDLLYQW